MDEIKATPEELLLRDEHVQRIVNPPARTWTPTIRCIRQSWGTPKMAKSIHGTELTLAGQQFTRGIGTHADSEIIIDIPCPADRFSAVVGVDDNAYTRSSASKKAIAFSIDQNGREIYSTEPLSREDQPSVFDVPLDAATSFTLKTREVNGNDNGAHADWADACIHLADGSIVPLGECASTQGPPISFRYVGQDSADFLLSWDRRQETELLDCVTLHRLIYTDPVTGLEITFEMKEFPDFAAVEWVARLKNTGSADTPIIEDIRALDFKCPAADKVFLRKSRGSTSEINDFHYTVEPLAPSSQTRLMPGEGRSSSGESLPFFNIETGSGGFIAAIGWTGRWAADFEREGTDILSIKAGLEKTHLKLHPGEEIRTPSIMLMFWQGDPLRAHNLLRRFITKYHTPTADGQPVLPPITCSTWGGTPTDRHLAMIEAIKRHGAEYDYYWIDAGWYGPPGRHCPDLFSDWAQHVGNWNCNTTDHPGGMRPISDAARAAGMKFLLWLEPERAVYGTPLTVDHPEWFLGEPGPGSNMLFNLGLPEAREWMTDYISGIITEFGIDLYRQDFNMDPLSYWRDVDAPDRQGMTEIRYIEGLYAFWDALLERHPGLVIDNCASGGRRLDLETTGRSIPLWRSDYQCFASYDPVGSQIHTNGLSYWLPISGTGTDVRPGNTYNFRSNLSAGISFVIDLWDQGMVERNYPWEWHHRMTRDFKRARPSFLGDYYPLTDPSISHKQWMAYQMQKPDLAEGFLIAFRRDESPFTSASFPLKALNPSDTYELEDADSGETWTATGEELLSTGIAITLPTPRESRLVFYKRIS